MSTIRAPPLAPLTDYLFSFQVIWESLFSITGLCIIAITCETRVDQVSNHQDLHLFLVTNSMHYVTDIQHLFIFLMIVLIENNKKNCTRVYHVQVESISW